MADLKAHLSEYADRAEKQGERFTITRNGRPSVVMVSSEDFAALEETIFWLSQSGIREDLAEAARGEHVMTQEEAMKQFGWAE
ncbi:hypothetical protein BH24ACT12_BH24ACT12_14620 [soil metagenome]